MEEVHTHGEECKGHEHAVAPGSGAAPFYPVPHLDPRNRSQSDLYENCPKGIGILLIVFVSSMCLAMLTIAYNVTF